MLRFANASWRMHGCSWYYFCDVVWKYCKTNTFKKLTNLCTVFCKLKYSKMLVSMIYLYLQLITKSTKITKMILLVGFLAELKALKKLKGAPCEVCEFIQNLN